MNRCIRVFCFLFASLLVEGCFLTQDLAYMKFGNDIGRDSSVQHSWQAANLNAPFGPRRNGHEAVSFNGNLWLIAGNVYYRTNDAWYSPDGTNWTCATQNCGFPVRSYFGLAVAWGKMWVVGGTYNTDYHMNDVWYTTNGSNWVMSVSNAEFMGREYHTVLYYNGSLWMFGGQKTNAVYGPEIWYSSNGSNWSLATSNAFPDNTWIDSCTVFNGRLWLIEHFILSGKNRIWSSVDGTNWQKAADAPFLLKDRFSFKAWDNRLWVIAGTVFPPAQDTNDVWYSVDGTNWCVESSCAPFSPRSMSAAAVHNNMLYLIAGAYTNDVWFY